MPLFLWGPANRRHRRGGDDRWCWLRRHKSCGDAASARPLRGLPGGMFDAWALVRHSALTRPSVALGWLPAALRSDAAIVTGSGTRRQGAKGSFWVILGHSGHSGTFLAILGHSGLFRIFRRFPVISGHFVIFVKNY